MIDCYILSNKPINEWINSNCAMSETVKLWLIFTQMTNVSKDFKIALPFFLQLLIINNHAHEGRKTLKCHIQGQTRNVNIFVKILIIKNIIQDYYDLRIFMNIKKSYMSFPPFCVLSLRKVYAIFTNLQYLLLKTDKRDLLELFSFMIFPEYWLKCERNHERKLLLKGNGERNENRNGNRT